MEFVTSASVPLLALLGHCASYSLYIESIEQLDFYMDLCMSLTRQLKHKKTFQFQHEIIETDKFLNPFYKAKEILLHKDYQQALEMLQDCQTQKTNDPHLLYQIAVALYKTFQFNKAIGTLLGAEREIGFVPDTVDIPEGPAGLYLLGCMYERMNYCLEALLCFSRCFEVCPIMWCAYQKLAHIAALRVSNPHKLYGEHLGIQDKLNEIFAPFDETTENYTGRSAQFENQLLQCIKVHGSAFSEFQTDLSTFNETSGLLELKNLLFYFETALWHFIHFQPRKAITFLLDKVYSCGLYYDLCGRCFYDVDRNKEAIAYFSCVESYNPFYTNHFGIFSVVLLHENDEPAFTEILKQNRLKNICDPQFLCFTGSFYLLKNEMERANDCFIRAIEKDDYCFIAYYYLGLLSVGQRDYHLALHNFLVALHLNPLMYQIYFGIGQLYLIEENYEAASSYLLQTLELNTHKLALWDLLSITLHKAGYTEQAVNLLLRGIEMHPTDLRYKYLCGINAMNFGDVQLSLKAFFDLLFDIFPETTVDVDISPAIVTAYNIALTDPAKSIRLIADNLQIMTTSQAPTTIRRVMLSLLSLLHALDKVHKKHFTTTQRSI